MNRPKRLRLAITVGLLVPASLLSIGARQPARQPTPNDTLISPEVLADRRVAFRICAPKASEVTLRGDWMDAPEPVALEKDGQGVWSITLGPLVPDFYSYTFTVDGVRTRTRRIRRSNRGSTASTTCSSSPARKPRSRTTPPSRTATSGRSGISPRRSGCSAACTSRLVRLLSIGVGDKDFAFAGSKNLSELLTRRGITNKLHVSGGGHTWINWRRYLPDFAQVLFRATS